MTSKPGLAEFCLCHHSSVNGRSNCNTKVTITTETTSLCHKVKDESEHFTEGAFVWDHSGIRKIGIMRVSVCLGAVLILE